MIITGVALVGVLAGIMSGMFGIGGGLIMVPMMITFLGMDLLGANATSLTAMLLPVGILGVINYHKAGLLNIRDALWISSGLLFGSYAGARLALSVDIHLLAKFYVLFLLYVSVSYLNLPAWWRKRKGIPEKPAGPMTDHAFWQFMLLGLFAGVIAGMFGKGGGIIIVPVLIKMFRYQPKMATATSLAALQLPVGLPSVIVYAQGGYLNWLYAVIMACGLVAGVFFGSRLAINLPAASFKRVYALFLICVSVYMTVKYF